MRCEKSGNRTGAQFLVRSMLEKGLSERRALVVARMNASALR